MTWRGLGHTPGGPLVYVIECLIIRSKSIYGLGVRIWAVSEILCLLWLWGVGHNPEGHPPPSPPPPPWSMSLNASYHKKQGYIWFKGGYLNGFFYEMTGLGIPQGTPGLCHWMPLIIRKNSIYMVYGVGTWKVSEIDGLFWTGRGWGKSLGNSISMDASYQKEQQCIWFMGGDLNGFSDIRSFMKWRGWGMLWQPSWISISSVFAVLCFLGAPMLLNKFQPKWIIVFRRDVQNMNSQHFFHINV